MDFAGNMQNFDDLDIEGRNPSHQSDIDREKEEHDRKRLMRSSVTAEDGTLRPVYSETDDGDIWCHICNVALFGAHKLISHNTCNRHKIKLDEWPYPVLLWSKRSDTVKTSISPQTSAISNTLAPGEPIPPGMEDQITRTTTIQVSLDRHRSSPLVGLEYLLELVDSDSCEPSYTCVLCDKRGDPRTVMAHITSYNHRITYLNRHFPTISRAITELPRTSNYKRGANEISVLVAKKIEEHFGRLQPQLVDKNQFEKSKMQYIKRVFQDYHFRETPELTFMDVYDVRWVTNFEEKLAEMTVCGGSVKKDDIRTNEDQIEENHEKEDQKNDKPLMKKIKPKIEPAKSTFKIRILTKDKLKTRKSMDKPDEISKNSNKKLIDETGSLSSLSSISSSPSPTRSKSRSPSRHRKFGSFEKSLKGRGRSRHTHDHSRLRSRTRSRTRSRSLEPIRERDKWDKYREQIKRAEETLDRALKFHEKNPEKHPAYPDEWKKFWNRRYKELQAEGKDPSKHDFKPEWIEFWNKRMRELHNEQLMQRKEEIKKRLDLPDDKPQEKWIPPNKREKFSPKRIRHRLESDDDVEYVGTTKTIKSEYYDRYETRERDYPHVPYVRGRGSYRGYYHRGSTRPRLMHYASTSYQAKEISPSPVVKDESMGEDMEVVGLLRLLTALEGQLGSLGPKVVSLLSKALAAEKTKPNSAEELLYDEEVSVLFETVKEKLKGQLFAGMIEKMAINPTKTAIQNIALLLHKASESKKKQEEEKKKKEQEILEATRPASLISRTMFNRTSEASSAPAVKFEPVSVPGIGTVDKVAIAQQIAAALVAQGRTNVSQDELETLINAVVGMAEASKNSEKPITTADFVRGLTSGGSNISSISSTLQTKYQPTVPLPPPPSFPLTSIPLLGPNFNPDRPLSSSPSLSPERSSASVSAPVSASITTPLPSTTFNFATSLPALSNPTPKIEDLSDDKLKNLLQNFKNLGNQEQHQLINFLKKLEATDPARVEKLRGFVNLGNTLSMSLNSNLNSPILELRGSLTKKRGSVSPFSTRKIIQNPPEDENKWKPKLDIFADDEELERLKMKDNDKSKTRIELSDDDDDYTFEDIYKAANKNVKESENARKTSYSATKYGENSSRSWSHSRSRSRSFSRSRSRSRTPVKSKDIHKINDPTAILNETKRLIANIMGELPNKYGSKSHGNTISPVSNVRPLDNVSSLNTSQIASSTQRFYNDNYRNEKHQSSFGSQMPPLTFPNSSGQQQYPNYQSQMFNNNNSGYADSGYNYHDYNSGPNQNQYQPPVNQYSHQQSYGSSQYSGPSNVYVSQQQQQQHQQQQPPPSYGNYTQHRFY
ncbi:uncharacterized protein CG7065-like [Prorops nasuta]|uniref:uncharacterized protein CG7065-like n=1 Tax=Prorops nasuta TaxID=863751 RepID=UPI0034CDFA5B